VSEDQEEELGTSGEEWTELSLVDTHSAVGTVGARGTMAATAAVRWDVWSKADRCGADVSGMLQG